MNRQNRYLGDNDKLLTKIDNLLQKSRATRQRFAGNNQQRGGAIPGYVSLDTPVNNMTGGGNSIDSEFDRTDASLAKADLLLAAFEENDELIGGGCGCGGQEMYPVHTADCGSRSYQSGGFRGEFRGRFRGRPNTANILSDLERDLNSVDALLSKF